MKNGKRMWALLLAGLSATMWFAPSWSGIFFPAAETVTAGDGRIASSILLVGALVLWYLPTKDH
jgi:hypothetical protein